MTRLVLKGARIWDGVAPGYVDGSVVCEEGRIVSVGSSPDEGGAVIDLEGRALLPGFIDAHFHAYASEVNLSAVDSLPTSYLAHHAANLLKAALCRGFTTVRDAGGADWGLSQAVEEGLIPGPRIFYSGRALSQTGGHGDPRAQSVEPCSCRHVARLSQVVDGVDEVRRAAREALRQGAHQLKIFVSGGVASPTDPIWMPQYSSEEIRAIVSEAQTRRTYVMAHAYTAQSILHAVGNGVRSIEHGNLLDAEAASAMADHGAFLDPTLITYEALSREGAAYGLPAASLAKLLDVAGRGAEAIRLARRAGVKVGFGTDLLGPLHRLQLHEFRLRGEIEDPLEVLRSATSVNAELLNRTGELGVVRTGAAADLVAVDGDPLKDLSCLYQHGPSLVVKAGRMAYSRL